MKLSSFSKFAFVGIASLVPSLLVAQSNPSVVVTFENVMPKRGALLTPVWLGIHDGSFDSYNSDAPASEPLGGNEIESMAEDGNNTPLSETFGELTEGAPQVAGLASATGPISPGDKVSVTVNINPTENRYFSYASMIIPSNDFFIANGNPLAHPLFDEEGNFVARNFTVSGDEVNDAGTEINDEIAQNVAFLNQSAPNTGQEENGVVSLADGFAEPGTLSFPNGVLSQPIFGNANFNSPEARIMKVSFKYVDLGAPRVFFRSVLSHRNQIQPETIDSNAFGVAKLIALDGEQLIGQVLTRGVSGIITGASLNIGSRNSNGPVVVDLNDSIRGRRVLFRVGAESLEGPLAEQDLGAFLNELAAGNIYLDIKTTVFPEGEVRGQLSLQ